MLCIAIGFITESIHNVRTANETYRTYLTSDCFHIMSSRFDIPFIRI